jgi:hypothetical protein
MPNIRIAAAGAILIAMVGAAAAQSDTSQAQSQEPGKPVSLLQMLFKPAAAETSGDADVQGATEAQSATEVTAHTKIVHRHWHHRRYASKKSHRTQDDDAAATTPAAQRDAAQANLAPPADASTAATATPASEAMTFDAPTTAPLPGTQATTPVEPSAMVVGGQTVQIASQNEINALDLAAGNAALNAPPLPATEQSKPAADTMAAADNMPAADSEPADNKPADTPVIAFAQRHDSDNSRDIWYEDLLATLGCLLAAASAAWFLIGRAPPRRGGGSEQMLVYEIEPMRR